MTSFISSLEIINVILRESKSGRRPDPNFFFFFWVPASVADLAVVKPNGIRFNACS